MFIILLSRHRQKDSLTRGQMVNIFKLKDCNSLPVTKNCFVVIKTILMADQHVYMYVHIYIKVAVGL